MSLFPGTQNKCDKKDWTVIKEIDWVWIGGDSELFEWHISWPVVCVLEKNFTTPQLNFYIIFSPLKTKTGTFYNFCENFGI